MAHKSATESRATGRTGMIENLNDTIATAYALNANDAELAAIGLALRVTGLSAEPLADGTVRLKWSRSGNRPTAIFVDQASPDGIEWTDVRSVSRCSATLDGYAPGMGAWFRVVATNAAGTSPPLVKAAIYTPSVVERPSLRVA